MYKSAIPGVVIDSWQGIKMAALEQSWSVTVRMLSNPFESGSLTMRSIATVSKGRAAGVTEIG